MKGARYLAEALHGFGVDHVFFMDAILRRTLGECGELGIRRILTHSEKAAAYMADGYARAGQRPGVVMAQSVGAANLAAGLQDARLFGSPVIAVTGRHPATNQYRNAYQELPHEPMFQAFVKASYRIDTIEQLPHLLRQAFREATSGPPGPVHLDVLGNTGSINDMAEVDAPPLWEFRSVPSQRPHPDPERLSAAVSVLTASKSPLLVAGAGAVISDASDSIRLLCEHFSMPLVTTLDAKGFLPSGHPLFVGVGGTYSSRSANRLMSEADVILFVGCEAGDQITNNFVLPSAGAKIIQIDINPIELGRNFPGAIEIWSDPRAAIDELLSSIPNKVRSKWIQRVADLVSEWQQHISVQRDSDVIPLRPERVCKELGEWLPSNAILVADTGYASLWTGTMLDLKSEDQTYLRAAGSLGWAFPASLGAKCACPDRPTVCFTGDGGFMYHLPELETAKRWGIATVTVVNNNSRLAQGLRNLRIAHEGLNSRMEDLFTFIPLDFAKIANAFGCRGYRVEKADQFRPALERALASGEPAVIDVVTDPLAQAELPWTPPEASQIRQLTR
jgi:acetolactate synthase-1/2/3 large subunit